MNFITEGTIGIVNAAPRTVNAWYEVFRCRECKVIFSCSENICQSCAAFSWEPIAVLFRLLPSGKWWKQDKFRVEVKPRSIVITRGA